jgi:DNA polymerase IV
VLHLDMDAFFASVEQLTRPTLRGRPVLVGGLGGRGVVAGASYEARVFGARSAMPMHQARRLIGVTAVVLPPRGVVYGVASRRVFDTVRSLVPVVEQLSFDEAFGEPPQLAGSSAEDVELFCEGLRRRVRDETGLVASVGAGSGKQIAKIASGLAKPNGLYEVPAGQEIAFLAALPIESLPGIGVKTQAFLNRDGINTVRQIQELGLEKAIQRYGAFGYSFYLAAMGRDSRPVESSEQPPKSIGAEETFEKDLADKEALAETLVELLDRVYKRLRAHRMRARGLSIKLRFADFTTITRSATLENHTNDHTVLLEEMLRLFLRVYDGKSPLRLVGVTLEKLTDSYWQPTFWD